MRKTDVVRYVCIDSLKVLMLPLKDSEGDKCPISIINGVVELSRKEENSVRSKSENATIYRNTTELNEESRSAGAIVP